MLDFDRDDFLEEMSGKRLINILQEFFEHQLNPAEKDDVEDEIENDEDVELNIKVPTDDVEDDLAADDDNDEKPVIIKIEVEGETDEEIPVKAETDEETLLNNILAMCGEKVKLSVYYCNRNAEYLHFGTILPETFTNWFIDRITIDFKTEKDGSKEIEVYFREKNRNY